MTSTKSLGAEFIGTFWLVFGGCGSALFAAAFPDAGIGFMGVSLAFGLTVLSMAFAIGHISGCHLNPAVTLGLAIGGRFSFRMVPLYVIAQVLGAILASALLYVIFMGQPGAEIGSFAANGYGDHSPGGYSMLAALTMEIIMTAVFLFVIMGATDKRAPTGLAPIAIGLCLTLIHLVSIPVTNTSVNPARSTSQALFAGVNWPLEQLWLFWLAPLVGGIIGAVIYRFVMSERE